MAKLTKEEKILFDKLKKQAKELDVNSSDEEQDEKPAKKRKSKGSVIEKIKKEKKPSAYHDFQKKAAARFKLENPDLMKDFPGLQRKIAAEWKKLGNVSKTAEQKAMRAKKKIIAERVHKEYEKELEEEKKKNSEKK